MMDAAIERIIAVPWRAMEALVPRLRIAAFASSVVASIPIVLPRSKPPWPAVPAPT
jgi:hypothetical protein